VRLKQSFVIDALDTIQYNTIQDVIQMKPLQWLGKACLLSGIASGRHYLLGSYGFSPTTIAAHHRTSSPMSLMLATRKNGNSGSNTAGDDEYDALDVNVDVDVDVDSVSDVEALLACRSHLQRRNKMGGWKQNERRKRMKEAASTQRNTFWEDPSELIYLHDPNSSQLDASQEVASWEDHQTQRVVFENLDEKNDYGAFTSFPTEPSPTRIRRSQSAKKTFANPEWKAMWYQRRWGDDGAKKSTKTRYQKQLDYRIRALPPGLLGSPELASMTEEEIAEAIRTYVISKQKRVDSRAKTLVEQKAALNPPQNQKTLPRDSLWVEDTVALKQAQLIRGERSKRLYETRLKNRQAKTTVTNAKKGTTRIPREIFSSSSDPSPKEALLRIASDLDQGELPRIEDIDFILKPDKLGMRKDLLRRILNDQFDLRGKCVPVDLDDPESDKVFVTKCGVQDLGNFVIHLLRSKQNKLKGRLD
jgi:hypothetical protein